MVLSPPSRNSICDHCDLPRVSSSSRPGTLPLPCSRRPVLASLGPPVALSVRGSLDDGAPLVVAAMGPPRFHPFAGPGLHLPRWVPRYLFILASGASGASAPAAFLPIGPPQLSPRRWDPLPLH